MCFHPLGSDQSYTWSDENSRRARCYLKKTPPIASAPAASVQEILRGSLIGRYKRCGKPGCKCADGPGHGPKYYLSVSHPGLRPQMDYVPQESHAQVAELSLPTSTEPARSWKRFPRSAANCCAAERRSVPTVPDVGSPAADRFGAEVDFTISEPEANAEPNTLAAPLRRPRIKNISSKFFAKGVTA